MLLNVSLKASEKYFVRIKNVLKEEKLIKTYVQQANEDGETLSELDYLTYDISGKYDVICHKNSLMEFSSKSTIKYSGQVVYITIER